MTAALTARQVWMLNALRRYIDANGYAPTVRELAPFAGLSSKAAVVYQLDQLVAKGVIRREPATARAIIILDGGDA